MKKIFTLFAALACIVSMFAATPTKIYLNAKDWGYGDARFAAYFFDPAKWVDMKKVDGETFIYEVDVPAGYTKVIFCRMNGGTTANNWDNKWNQTGNLDIPTDGKNMFKPDGWDGKTTTWSTYTPTVTHTFAKGTTLYIDFRAITGAKRGANYPKAGEVGIDYSANAGGTVIPVTFTADVKWAEGAEFMKTEQGGWASILFHAPTEGANCAQVAADGKSYTWTTYSEPTVTLSLDKTEADAGTEITVTLTATADNVTGDVTYAFQYSTDEATWNDMEATGNTATQTFAAETRYYKVTMTNGGTTKEATAKFTAIKFHVIGSWDNWQTHHEIVDGSKTITLEADSTYEYKITAGNWDIHWGNNGTMTRDNCTGWSFDADSNNAKITTDMAGEYVFNVSRNTEGKVVVSVTYPALPTPKYTVTLTNNIEQDSVYLEGVGMVAVTEGAGEYEAGEEVEIRAHQLGDYYFIGWADENGEIITQDLRYVFTITEDVTYTAMYATLLSVTSTDLDLSTPNHLKGTDPTFQMGTLTIDLVLGELDDEEGSYAIVPEESTLAVGEVKFQIEEGIAVVDAEEGLAMARVFVTFEEQLYVFDIEMSAAVTAEVIDVTIENATVNITEYETGFGGGKATELVVSADWVYEADGLTYKVMVVIAEFDPTATSGEYTASFFVQGEGDASGMTEEAEVTVAIEGGKVIVTGEGIQAYNDNVYNLTISGTMPVEDEPATSVDNLNTTVAPVKMIENGQLIVIKDGVKFNAAGAVVK